MTRITYRKPVLGGLGSAGSGGWAGPGVGAWAGPGWLSPLSLAQHRLEGWQPSPEQLLSKHLGCCDRAVHHPGL